jgi:hypothetical protein
MAYCFTLQPETASASAARHVAMQRRNEKAGRSSGATRNRDRGGGIGRDSNNVIAKVT